MTPDKILIKIAKIHHGYQDFDWLIVIPEKPRVLHGSKRENSSWREIEPYLTNGDTIRAVIQQLYESDKHDELILSICSYLGGTPGRILLAKPAQLCEALLRSLGEWEE